MKNDASQALSSLVARRSVPRPCEPKLNEMPVSAHLEQAVQDDGHFLRQLAENEKLAEMGRLSRQLLDELATPLSVIVSAAQMILREQALPEPVGEMAERIDLEAEHLVRLCKGLQSFVRDDGAGGGETDVNQLLIEVLAFQEDEARRQSIGVLQEFAYGIPPVKAEARNLRQVFCNLLANAFQAMESGGLLTIRTWTPADREVEVIVTDTGGGIPADIAGRIFDPFFTTKGLQGGTGLGLYISRKLIEDAGGRIRVESKKGSGTSFFVTLPAAGYDGPFRM